MTSISNLLIHDTPILSSFNLPPIHGDDPPQTLRYHDTLSPRLSLYPTTHIMPIRQRSLSTSSSSSSSNSTIMTDISLKRKRRGRPPITASIEDDQITFLTPTVLHIPVSKDQKEREMNAKQVTVEDDAMTAFTSSNMEIVLAMPRRKRGRKPKTFIHGNSCFIWKDLTCVRSTK